MSDNEPTPQPDVEQAPGWVVLDADGNVVDSGPLTELEAVGNPGDEEQEQ